LPPDLEHALVVPEGGADEALPLLVVSGGAALGEGEVAQAQLGVRVLGQIVLQGRRGGVGEGECKCKLTSIRLLKHYQESRRYTKP
jgi:hypothetical protein